MIKAVAKYLLSLGLLILCASNQLYANSTTEISTHSPKGFIGTECPNPVLVHLYFKQASSPSHTRKQTYNVSMPLFENEEDNEVTSFKKNLKNACYPKAILFIQSAGQFSSDMQGLPVACYNVCSSSDRYLMIRVFRI